MKKVYTVILVIMLFCGLLAGCRASAGNFSTPITTYPLINYHVIYSYSDYGVEYTAVEPLVNKADYVLLGTVTGITFEAYPLRPDSPDDEYCIQTLYTIEASQYLKGNSDETVTLVVPYGMSDQFSPAYSHIPDYLEEEQRKLAQEYGITNIYYWDPFPLMLELGETYALILCEGEDGRMVNVSPKQYAFNVNDTRPTNQTYYLCYEDFLIYYGLDKQE